MAPGFGEIFRANCFANGMLPIVLPEAQVLALADELAASREPVLTIDLPRSLIIAPGHHEIPFEISADRKSALLEGLDETSLILRMEPEIDAFRAADRTAHPWLHMR